MVTNNTLLFGKTYCTMYGPNHFLVNFPKRDLLPFGHNIITKIKLFSRFFCWLHNALFHYRILVISIVCILVSCNFSSCVILLVKTLIEFIFFSFPPTIGIIYSMGINGCNPYTNWYGVYLVATLYAILYENNTIDRCSSNLFYFHWLTWSTCPFLWRE